MSGRFTSETIRDFETLEACEYEWWELWRRSPAATPFQSPAWLLPWWQAFSPGTLNVIAIRDRSRLVALAPFYVECGDARRMLPIGISASDYLDVLLAPECAEAAGKLVSAMAVQPWDAWEFPALPPGAAALELPLPAGCSEEIANDDACPVLLVPESAQDWTQILPPRKRQDLRRALRRSARRGSVEIEHAEEENAPRFFEALVRLHGLRWETLGERGVLSDPRVLRFHREAILRLANTKLLRLYTLAIGGEVVAAYYGFLHRDCAHGYLTGFDPAQEFVSPGALLLGHALTEAIREGAREFHFLRGREAYKYRWGASDRWNQRRVIYRAAAHALAS
ncbi:MAG TPA: GNAT family N-acetyltransferase [Xanthobacteraceae bacterium]|nr:GNAT family N-acetyltransferase [Xanthobacteraceae bacterium]